MLLLFAMRGLALAQQSDTIYVSDFKTQDIERFRLSDAMKSIFVPAGVITKPTGLVFDPAGNLYVSTSNPPPGKISKVTPSGSVSLFSDDSHLGQTHGLAFDSSGNLFVATAGGNTVLKFTRGISTPAVFADASDSLVCPMALAFDTQGNLFVSDAKAFGGSVFKFTPAGIGSQFATVPTAYGLAFDQCGNLYVSSQTGSFIEKFAPDGTDLGTFASGLASPLGMGIRSEWQPLRC